MDWMLFWTAFGAIGGTLGAFATAGAVIVALWQTKISYKKKIELSFTDKITIVPEQGTNFKRFIGVTVTNSGNRDVVINSWGFGLDNDSVVIITPDLMLLRNGIQKPLPYRLIIEDSITLYYEKEIFERVILECIEKKTLIADKKIKFFVNDSTSTRHFVETDNVAEYYAMKESNVDTNTIYT